MPKPLLANELRLTAVSDLFTLADAAAAKGLFCLGPWPARPTPLQSSSGDAPRRILSFCRFCFRRYGLLDLGLCRFVGSGLPCRKAGNSSCLPATTGAAASRHR